ncbi:MAG: hypothetical protein QF464_23920, partial [Myxococcota bacterium]|nr:hypothetical protein [Myxococcota bacterium]
MVGDRWDEATLEEGLEVWLENEAAALYGTLAGALDSLPSDQQAVAARRLLEVAVNLRVALDGRDTDLDPAWRTLYDTLASLELVEHPRFRTLSAALAIGTEAQVVLGYADAAVRHMDKPLASLTLEDASGWLAGPMPFQADGVRGAIGVHATDVSAWLQGVLNASAPLSTVRIVYRQRALVDQASSYSTAFRAVAACDVLVPTLSYDGVERDDAFAAVDKALVGASYDLVDEMIAQVTSRSEHEPLARAWLLWTLSQLFAGCGLDGDATPDAVSAWSAERVEHGDDPRVGRAAWSLLDMALFPLANLRSDASLRRLLGEVAAGGNLGFIT